METADCVTGETAYGRTPLRIRPSFRVRLASVLALLAIALCVWCWYFVVILGTFQARLGERGTYSGDFTMFISGAAALEQGKNPYHHVVLLQVERSFLNAHGLTLRLSRPEKVRVGYPPIVFWAMRPLTHAPFQPLGVAWLTAMYFLSAAGFLALLRFLRWQHRLVPTAIFLLLPQVIKGAAYGNLTGLVFAGVGVSLLLSRRHPYWAGAILNLLWLKPQVGCAVFLLIVLFHVPQRMKLVLGAAGGTAVWVALTLLTTGPRSLLLWINGLMSYYHDVTQQTYLPSLVNLYDWWAPIPLRVVLSGACVLVALAGTLTVFLLSQRRLPASALAVSALWFLWFVATPYVHLYDEVFLALPILLCLGHNGHRIVRPLPAFGIVILAFTWLPFAWIPWEVAALGITLALLNLGLPPRLRSSPILLAALCGGYVGYANLPAHDKLESLVVIASGVSLLSIALRRPREPGKSHRHATAP